jgi:hypothetical protein
MMNQFRIAVVVTLCGLFLSCGTAQTRDRNEKASENKIVVWVYKVHGQLVCEVNAVRHPEKDCGFVLGELRLTHRKDTQVVMLISEETELSTIRYLGSKVLDAGFVNLQTYVQWQKTGLVAEIQLGRVTDPGSVGLSK